MTYENNHLDLNEEEGSHTIIKYRTGSIEISLLRTV
jgi:hypothetical protein